MFITIFQCADEDLLFVRLKVGEGKLTSVRDLRSKSERLKGKLVIVVTQAKLCAVITRL